MQYLHIAVFLHACRHAEAEMIEDDSPFLSEEAILKAIERAQARATQGERDRAELDRAIATAREEERLLLRLLEVRRGPRRSKEPHASEQGDSNRAPATTVARGDSRHPAVQAVVDEL